jgi:hypothetical protein
MLPGVFVIRLKGTEKFVHGRMDSYTTDLREAAFFVSDHDARRRLDPDKVEEIVPLNNLVTFVWPDEPEPEPTLDPVPTDAIPDVVHEIERQYLVF